MGDQTKRQWLGKPDELGTGVYAIPDARSPLPGGMRKIYVTDISHADFRDIQVPSSTDYQWVPKSIEDFWSLSRKSCGQPCPSGECVEPGCLCSQGTCI